MSWALLVLLACPPEVHELPVLPAPLASLPNQDYAMGLPGNEPSAELSGYIQASLAAPPPPPPGPGAPGSGRSY